MKVEWMAQAACLGSDPDLFFPPEHVIPHQAKRICGGCPVEDRCLDYALEQRIEDGIWGGLSQKARNKVRKARRVAATRTCASEDCNNPLPQDATERREFCGKTCYEKNRNRQRSA